MKQTLGFLKKKRTKESSAQKDSESTSQPTSPITPTSPRPFDNSITSVSTNTTPPQTASTTHSAPIKEESPTVSGTMTQGVSQQQQTYVASPHNTGSQVPAEQQILPSISNLINPPQHDGAAQSYPASMASTTSTTVANGGPGQVDNSQILKQAQQPVQIRQTKGKYSLGDFEILRTLGTGSFGRVHLVQSKHNQRFYAVKVLKKQQVVKMKQVEHTNDERKMLQEVKHPFLITLWGTFQDSKNLYMVMDFVEGGELFSLLRKSQVCLPRYLTRSLLIVPQRFPNPVAKFYAAEVTLALEYLHSKQIIYRDLKPENLLLDRHGHLKITDFGFAKKVPDITWTLCGTPDYLAPEVVSSKGYNKSVDWSVDLGTIVWTNSNMFVGGR